MADNFHFSMLGVPLDDAMRIAFTHHKTAWGWAVLSDKDEKGVDRTRMVLYWTNTPKATPFPSPLTCDQVVPIVKEWLDKAKMPSAGIWDDGDVDLSKGSLVYNEAWGHVSGMWEAFVAIESAVLLYGK